MDGVQTAVVSTCISCKTGTWRHAVCVCVCVFAICVVWHISRRGVCYPCLLESDPRLCLIGVFTLSGLTHTDTLDLGSPPFAMKRENSDTETRHILSWEDKLCCYLFLSPPLHPPSHLFHSRCLFPALVLRFQSRLFSVFEAMNFSTTGAWSKRHTGRS